MKPVRRSVWYGLSTSMPTGGRNQSTAHRDEQHHAGEHAEVEPADAGDEEAGAERGEVDEPAAEVGLEEDEQHRRTASAIASSGVRDVLDAPDPVGEEGGDEEDEQELPELRGLEAEERDVDPAPRAARDGAHERARAPSARPSRRRAPASSAGTTAGSTRIAATISTAPTPAKTSWRDEVVARLVRDVVRVMPAIAQRPKATRPPVAASSTQSSRATAGAPPRASERPPAPAARDVPRTVSTYSTISRSGCRRSPAPSS